MATQSKTRKNIMIYAIIALVVLILALYACGCFLMRAFLKYWNDDRSILCYAAMERSAVGSVIIPQF
ncbi:hypothetical protein QJS64_19825 (plasmid) [Paraclostridium bifermentans]|uniref:Uncharacterized protein n=1 Tax=Paraclostridium bifermentans TaxID=1490 RepID=A0ABY8R7C2_PARBF|nr:hypothetical protein QJS64_19825 [Paraclostridium bifermentans]